MIKSSFPIALAMRRIALDIDDTEILPSDRFEADPFRVFVSCIVSLRTRDAVTRKVSDRLFEHIQTVQHLAAFNPDALGRLMYPAGFYRQKAAQLVASAAIIIERFGGELPKEIDDLIDLPGVGRKTANLVRTVGFGLPGICVDTHVHRICNRFGLVKTKTPDHTETALREVLPKRYWLRINRMLVFFGQQRCRPQYPRCSDCPLASICLKIGVTNSR